MTARRGIVGAGNWILDIVKTVDRWPGEGNLCNIHNIEQGGGGGPCNVLFDLAAMNSGIPLYAAGMLGTDGDGDWLLSEIEKRGIDSRHMVRIATAPTSFTDVISTEGRRTFFHCRGANAHLDYETLAAIKMQGRIFYLGYLLLLDELDREDCEYGTRAARVFAAMRKRGFLTVADFVSEAPEKFRRIVLPALKEIDILVINEIEAGCTFGLEIRRADNSWSREALRESIRLFFEHGVGALIVIHFPEGAVAARRNGEICFCPSFAIAREEMIGTNGAGDAFCAGILYGVHENLPVSEMLQLAAASAAFNLKAATASGGAVPLSEMYNALEKEDLQVESW